MKKIYRCHAKRGGVYAIVNIQNLRTYIGSCKCFKTRVAQHQKSLQSGTHHNKFLQNDWNKCGENNFTFQVIEVVDSDRLERTIAEQKHLDLCLQTGLCYNHKLIVIEHNRETFSRDPEKTKQKMSNARKGKTWKELFGPEKAIKLRKKLSQRMTGENNHFYGQNLEP